MATLANLRTYVSSRLGLDNTAAGAEQLLMDGWANEAVLQILLRTHCRTQAATLALTANEKNYELPAGIIAIARVIDANGEPLERVSPEEIYDLRRATGTTATGIYRYAVDGVNLFMVWPTPTAADVLTFYYVPKPTAMSDGAHDPSSSTYGGIPAEHHKAIEYWMLAEGADYDDDQTSEQGQRYRALFEAECKLIRRAQRFRGGRKMSPARLGRRPRLPTSPSQDI